MSFHMVSDGFPSSCDNKSKIIDFYSKYNIENVYIKRYDNFGNLGDLLCFNKSNFDKFTTRKIQHQEAQLKMNY